MNYFKKIVVLKQTEDGFSSNSKEVCGIVRLEEENDVLTLQLSLINLKGTLQGEYRLCLIDGKGKLFTFALEKKPQSLKTVLEGSFDFNGVATGLVFVTNDLPVLVAFGRTDGCKFDKISLRKSVAEKCLLEKKEKEKEKEKENENEKTAEVISPVETLYNDEAVATENYYDIKELNDERICTETDLQRDNWQEETQKTAQFDFAFQDEKDADFSQEMPYYFTAKKELDSLFDKFPSDESLIRYFPDSKWVKIYYSPEKFYLVGLVRENSSPKYICYGVPDRYSEKAPSALDGFCSFIPLSLFDLKGDGYWMIFQDAITGNCIKK